MEKSKIKVLHISQAVGGIQTYINNIVINGSDEFQHAIACPESDLSDLSKKLGLQTFIIPFVRNPNIFIDLLCLFKLMNILKIYEPQVIHTHSAKGGVIGRFAAFIVGKKRVVIYTPHAFAHLGFLGIKKRIYLSIEKIAKHWTEVLLAVSDSEKNRAINEVGFKDYNVKVVANSINIYYDKTQFYRDYSFKNHIGMIARLNYQKNPEMFIDVAINIHKIYPKIKFSILGAGLFDFLKPKLLNKIKKKNCRSYIELLNWGDGKSANEYLKNLDIFILTSKFEGLPFSLLEAMSLGLPVVVTNVDGNKDVVINEVNGYIVDDGNVEMMTKRIISLIENESLRKVIGQSARNHIVNNFNATDKIKEIEKIYNLLKR